MPIDKSKYPTDWKDISKRIRERANDRCEWCDVQNYDINPVTGSLVVLTVAHLDQNPQNNDDNNLACLCQLCHNRYDAPYRAKNRSLTFRRKREELTKSQLKINFNEET